MKSILRLLSVILLTLTISSQAAMPAEVVIVGKVGKIQKKLVTLKTKSGKVRVPKSAVKNKRNIRPGRTVKVRVSLNDIYRYN